MNPEKQREIASKGGKAVPAEKRAYSQNAALASKAGQKGGRSVALENRTFSRDPGLASTAGTKGGAAPKKGARPEEG